jgi:precorrin-3B methylase
LIRKITEAIGGCRPSRYKRKLAVVAYADDVIIIYNPRRRYKSFKKPFYSM